MHFQIRILFFVLFYKVFGQQFNGQTTVWSPDNPNTQTKPQTNQGSQTTTKYKAWCNHTVVKQTMFERKLKFQFRNSMTKPIDICYRDASDKGIRYFANVTVNGLSSIGDFIAGTHVRVTYAVNNTRIKCKGGHVHVPFVIDYSLASKGDVSTIVISDSTMPPVCPPNGNRKLPTYVIHPNGYKDTDGTVISRERIIAATRKEYGWKEYKNRERFFRNEKLGLNRWKFRFHENRVTNTMRVIMKEDTQNPGYYEFQGVLRHPGADNGANTFVRATKHNPCVTDVGAVSRRSLGECLNLSEAEAEEQSYLAIQAAVEGETEGDAAEIISTIADEALAEELAVVGKKVIYLGSEAFEILQWAIALFFI
jgi:hypothetical protein